MSYKNLSFDKITDLANKGYYGAEWELANRHENGFNGTLQCTDSAVFWYRDIARKFHCAKASRKIMEMIKRGEIQENKDIKSFSDNVCRHAKKGNPEFQLLSGDMYAEGVSVDKNPTEAWAWYAVASANGCEEAAGKRDQIDQNQEQEQNKKNSSSFDKKAALDRAKKIMEKPML